MATLKDTSVTLVVQNPKKLFELKTTHPIYDRIVSDNISFISDRGARSYPGDIKEDYISDVHPGKEMSWTIILPDPRIAPDYEVSLVEVTGNACAFFVDQEIELSYGILTGQIVSTGVTNEEEKKYSITFKITGPAGSTAKEIIVDPKLKIIT